MASMLMKRVLASGKKNVSVDVDITTINVWVFRTSKGTQNEVIYFDSDKKLRLSALRKCLNIIKENEVEHQAKV